MAKTNASANSVAKNLFIRTSDIEALVNRGYVLGKKIGKGSYATVVKANYLDDAEKRLSLACKIVDKSKAPSDFLSKFFPRELDIITKIEHPNVIQVHSILQRGPKIFIFMRYADNGDLLDYIKLKGPVAEPQSKDWFKQMLSGLKYLHSLKIAHRDLKCENILLSKRMIIKIADFGFAKFYDESKKLSETYCGSAAYAAPEVVSGVPYDPQISDIWSLGVILFIMLNASMPFDDNNLSKLLDDQKNRVFHFRSRVVNVLSSECKQLVHDVLNPDCTTRFTIDKIETSPWMAAEISETPT